MTRVGVELQCGWVVSTHGTEPGGPQFDSRCGWVVSTHGTEPGGPQFESWTYTSRNPGTIHPGTGQDPILLKSDHTTTQLADQSCLSGQRLVQRPLPHCVDKSETTPALKPEGREASEVRNRGYQWPHNRILVRQKLFKKNTKLWINSCYVFSRMEQKNQFLSIHQLTSGNMPCSSLTFWYFLQTFYKKNIRTNTGT